MIRTYSELISLPTFEERFEYCCINGKVGQETFGGSRYLNQNLYKLPGYLEWRRKIILRDRGCDLGIWDRPIGSGDSKPGARRRSEIIIVHHLNPLTIDDVLKMRPCCMDDENVICVSHNTHNAIHYGDMRLLDVLPPERFPNDQIPWRL